MSDVPLPAADPWLEVHLILEEVRKAITRARAADALQALTEARARLQGVETVLRSVEWGCHDDWGQSCPSCEGTILRGHAAECALAAVLNPQNP